MIGDLMTIIYSFKIGYLEILDMCGYITDEEHDKKYNLYFRKYHYWWQHYNLNFFIKDKKQAWKGKTLSEIIIYERTLYRIYHS